MKENFTSARIFMGSLTNLATRPFRRLVTEMGAEATLSEMVIANYAAKGGKQDRALMRREAHEKIWGVQIVGGNPSHLAKTAKQAEYLGADFIDFNCACPHHSVVSHGGGADLLRRPEDIERLLTAIKDAVSLPVTLKIRKGFGETDNVVPQVVQIAESCGAAAVFIHARTRFAQYRGPNDWQLIEETAQTSRIPIIGCGDLAHGSMVLEKMKHSACAGFALARGALIKPWIFKEIALGEPLDPSSEERLGILQKLARYTLEAFGFDERGHKRARDFLHKQLEWLARYVPTGAFGRELPLQEREGEWTPRDPLEDLMRQHDAASFDTLLHIAGFDDLLDPGWKPDPQETGEENRA